mgnify:FL=1
MKIIIAGAGAVGTHLARMLSTENINVILIDANEDRLSKVNSDMDIMTLCVEPTSIEGLSNAGIDNADLFIAVTPDESENITCSMLAKQLGAKRVVARIDNYEYMKPANRKLFESMGINSLIYPELLASREIADSCKYSWVRQLWEFGDNGDLVLLSVKMHDSHPIYDKEISNSSNVLVGHTLREIGMKHGHKFHVVAIKRNGETIHPNGDVEIMARDLVFFMTTHDAVSEIAELAGKDGYPSIHNTMIIGGGKLSVRADWALPSTMDIKIVEPDSERCDRLSGIVKPDTMVINGECHDMDLLYDEGLDRMDAFIALTQNDEENILACVAARRRGVRKTIAQVENIDYLEMAESLDVGTVINKKVIAASHIYQMLLKSSVDNVKMLTVAEADVAEFVVKKGSRVTRDTVMNLGLPRGVNIGGMFREGKAHLVGGGTLLQEGDRVVVFCISGTLKRLDKFFK